MKKNKNWISNNYLSLTAMYIFFLKYLKRQKILAVIVFIVLPIFFTCDMLLLQNNTIKYLPITVGIIFILLGFCGPIYTIGGFLVDLKSSVVYKRIGLTGIKPLGFLIVATLYCLTITLISDIIGLLTILIIVFLKHLDIALVFNWNTLILIVLSFFTCSLLTISMQLFVIFINSSVIQSLVTSIVAIFTIGGSFLINGFNHKIFYNGQTFFTHNELLSIIGIFLVTIILSSIIGYLTIKFFRWTR